MNADSFKPTVCDDAWSPDSAMYSSGWPQLQSLQQLLTSYYLVVFTAHFCAPICCHYEEWPFVWFAGPGGGGGMLVVLSWKWFTVHLPFRGHY